MKKITLLALTLSLAFNAYAQTSNPSITKTTSLQESKNDSLTKVYFLNETYFFNLPSGFRPLIDSNEPTSKTIIYFPKNQTATKYNEVISLNIFKKQYSNEDYVNKSFFEEWLREEAQMKCPLGHQVLPVKVAKNKNFEMAMGSFICNYKDESNVKVTELRSVALKQLPNSYLIMTASIKKTSSLVTKVTDIDNLLKQSTDLLISTDPIIGCPDSKKANTCLIDYKKTLKQ